MFCTECGTQVDRTFKFCPECGNKLFLLSQKKAQDGATSAHPISTTAEEKNQKEDQDQAPKEDKGIKENTTQIQGQLATDVSELDSKGPASSHSNADPATVENESASSSLHQTQFDSELAACEEKQKQNAVAAEINSDSCSGATPETNLSVPKTTPSATSAHSKIPAHQTRDSSDIDKDDTPDPYQIPSDKRSDVHSGPLFNSKDSPITKEAESTVPESSEDILKEAKAATQPAPHQDANKTTSHEIQNLSRKSADTKNSMNTDQNTFTKQADRKKDQVGVETCYSDDQNTTNSEKSSRPSPVTKDTSKDTEATSTNSNKDTGAYLAKEQQRGKRDVVGSRPPTSSCPPHHSDVQVGHQRPQNSSVSEGISIYFHVVVSNDFHLDPEKDFVVLKSAALLGNWDAYIEMFPRSRGDKGYLVETRVKIPKEKIQESIPYKYAVYKHSKKEFIYETIYQKEKNDRINRCLSIKQELLTREGEWHQYDDMIHPKLNTAWYWNTAKKTVMEGRDQAGWEMLKIIFDLLTTWNEQNVENFFLLLQQFIHTYTYPLLHDGMEKQWGLPYGSEQIKYLLKKFLEEIIGFRARKKSETVQSLLPNLHAGIIGLLVYNKYLKDSMRDKLSILCRLLCLPELAQGQFATFWENFANPLTDKKRVADALENLCHTAITHHIEKWVLVIPLIHLLRGESKPFEPVSPVLNPQSESWRGLRGIKVPSYAQ
uniref:E3 ubiquitin-protein ligase rnf213-alpha n=1 Tax=Maylandia zebra TaxID=106582 RepID=A0A3P9CJF2_9CICH